MCSRASFCQGWTSAVSQGRIACIVADADYCIGPDTRVIKAQGRFMLPGLADAHMHVESSMCSITEFVRAVLPRGTTAIFADPHEIANVFGLDGVRMMVEEAAAHADQRLHADALLRALCARVRDRGRANYGGRGDRGPALGRASLALVR